MDKKYVPESCVWELTLRCNMRCIHCGSSAGKAREKELTVDECLDVADELLDLGCRNISFLGGEIFLYKGWEKVAKRMSDGGAHANIMTNAFQVGEEEIRQMRYAGIENVGVSLDGLEKNHNLIRNSTVSFKRVMDTLDLFRREEIPVSVVTSLIDRNFGDLDGIYELLIDKGIETWQIQIVNAMGSMTEKRDLLLDPAKVPLITRFIREKRDELKVRIYAADDIGYFDENEFYIRNRPGTISIWEGCQAGRSVVGIDSVGNVKGCESLYSEEFIEGNVREESLKEIWTKEGNFSYNRQFDMSMLAGGCEGCDMGQICRGGCRGSSYFTSGNRFENIYCCYPKKKVRREIPAELRAEEHAHNV